MIRSGVELTHLGYERFTCVRRARGLLQDNVAEYYQTLSRLGLAACKSHVRFRLPVFLYM